MGILISERVGEPQTLGNRARSEEKSELEHTNTQIDKPQRKPPQLEEQQKGDNGEG